jgi:hypothetical protein
MDRDTLAIQVHVDILALWATHCQDRIEAIGARRQFQRINTQQGCVWSAKQRKQITPTKRREPL